MIFDRVREYLISEDEECFYAYAHHLKRTVKIMKCNVTSGWKPKQPVEFIVLDKVIENSEKGIVIKYYPLRNLKDPPSAWEIAERIKRTATVRQKLDEEADTSFEERRLLMRDCSFFQAHDLEEEYEQAMNSLIVWLKERIFFHLKALEQWVQESSGSGYQHYAEIKTLTSELKKALGYKNGAFKADALAEQLYEQGLVKNNIKREDDIWAVDSLLPGLDDISLE